MAGYGRAVYQSSMGSCCGLGDAAAPDTGCVVGADCGRRGGDPLGAGSAIELHHDLAGRGQHHRVSSCGAVEQPALIGVFGRRGQVTDMDPAVIE
ncbi:MAG: hypothetical protein J0H43_09895, partial [Actinobacteria bacterium]|nr:hypothetical protein [Actinomycetota bacterium]